MYRIKEEDTDFKFIEEGSIWENRIEYYTENGHLVIVHKDVTAFEANRWECDNIYTYQDIMEAIDNGYLPKLSPYEQLMLIKGLGIRCFDFFENPSEKDMMSVLAGGIYDVIKEHFLTGKDYMIRIELTNGSVIDILASFVGHVQRHGNCIQINYHLIKGANISHVSFLERP